MVQLTLADIILSSFGGIAISLSTSFHLYMKGRITGFSGIFYSLISFDKSSLYWKAALICGLITTSAILYDIFKFDKVWDNTQIFDSPTTMIANLDFVGFALAGYLVGVGTKLSNGCTSGHGVCGLPRFSQRSWVSVGVFLILGICLSTLKYHEPFLNETQGVDLIDSFQYDICANIFLALSILIFVILLLIEKKDKLDIVVGYVTGVLFAIGLGFGGMFRRSKISGFLSISKDWDPSLMFVLGFAVGLNMITFYLIQNKVKKPLLAEKLQIPTNKTIDARLIVGSLLFGLGWGLGGLCPGPAMGLLPIFSLQISVTWLICLAFGQYTVAFYDKYQDKQNKLKSVFQQPQQKEDSPMNQVLCINAKNSQCTPAISQQISNFSKQTSGV
ncbi:hypothetical protein ABPG74_018254 [Tetrahymena malaccensis]